MIFNTNAHIDRMPDRSRNPGHSFNAHPRSKDLAAENLSRRQKIYLRPTKSPRASSTLRNRFVHFPDGLKHFFLSSRPLALPAAPEFERQITFRGDKGMGVSKRGTLGILGRLLRWFDLSTF